jgi:hypothetical protein
MYCRKMQAVVASSTTITRAIQATVGIIDKSSDGKYKERNPEAQVKTKR